MSHKQTAFYFHLYLPHLSVGHLFLVHTLDPKTQVPHFTLWPLVCSYKAVRPRPVSVPEPIDSTVHNVQHIMEQNDTKFC